MVNVVSGTNTFDNVQGVEIITDAYERIGLVPDLITGQKIQTAIRTANLLLSDWINRGLNLYTVKQEMLGLNPGQNTYTLPNATSDILEATIRTSVRNLGGTAFSSAGGTAANAFDANTATACTQTVPDGYISYDFGVNVQIPVAMVGVQSNATLTWSLVFEYSVDNVTWTTAYTPSSQSYPVGQIIWAVIPQPNLARYFRVRVTGGGTLNVQELYFDTALQDTTISRISRSEWVSYPQKNQQGRPTTFYVDRQNSPTVVLWPTPTAQYNNMYYTRVRMINDFGAMVNQPDTPQRFFEPLTAGMAYKLSVKFMTELNIPLQKIQLLQADYADSFKAASEEDTERVPMRIFGDFQGGWTSIS